MTLASHQTVLTDSDMRYRESVKSFTDANSDTDRCSDRVAAAITDASTDASASAG